MTTRTEAAPGVVHASSATRAATQAAAATPEIQGADPRSRAVRDSARCTAAKTVRKPALPIVEMLSRSKTLAARTVAADVRSSPSSGRFQIGRSSRAGSSLEIAIAYLRRAEPYSVALIADAVDSIAATAISQKPVAPSPGRAATARA